MSDGLRGKLIVNTRAIHQANELNLVLQARGATVLNYPCIEIVPPANTAALDQALRDLAAGRFTWLILTSANTVLAIAERLRVLKLTLDQQSFATIAVGSATAHAAQSMLGIREIALPPTFVAESLAESLDLAPNTTVLLPESAIARPILADLLRAKGAHVTVVNAYQTICLHDDAQRLPLADIHAITFTSSSTVTCFVERLRRAGQRMADVADLLVACIGTKTATTARACGFTRIITAAEHTLDGLVTALDYALNN